MNYRTATILAEKSLSGAGTETIPILVKDIISRILLTWRTAPSKHGMDSYMHRDITKIELVDGSDVLFGMNGGQCQALCIYDRKVQTMNYGQHMMGDSQLSNYGLDFGRFLYDTEMAFDPTKFSQPTLKVSYDVDVSDTGVTSGNLEVRAEIFDEKIVTPRGFLMSKEHNSRTPPATGYWYVDLPTDHALRKLLIQGYQSAYEPWYQVTEAKLDEDNDKRTPFDWVLETYYRNMQGVWLPVEEFIIGLTGAASKDYYVTPTDYWTQLILSSRNDAQIPYPGASCRGGKATITTASGGGGVMGIARGFLPNHCFEFPFGVQEDIGDWYDIRRVGSLRLRLKAGSAGAAGTVAVILQQLREYGA